MIPQNLVKAIQILNTSTIVQSLAIVGGRGLLPCNVSLPGSDHPPTLIIWYKNEGGDPVYSYDLRGTRSENSRHWSDDHVLGSRANFKIQFTNSRRRRPEVNSRVESTIPPKKYIGEKFSSTPECFKTGSGDLSMSSRLSLCSYTEFTSQFDCYR
ncbi:unnamed protein product [Lepeophtheirus salmonis]|uniref:(salmon louse) hypothetical protein n=1 Tax=Lepeophtheirus salmonis TaxID=72036 RepID=A0A7R8HCC3_LEPSM|nr:unnamed protein product [Lepeophtheirus salmonis]CAF3005311.1 unnamed protein product [Lepeophtheirus salmonis]